VQRDPKTQASGSGASQAPGLEHVGAETTEAQPDQEQVLVLHNQVIRGSYVRRKFG